MAGAAAGLNGIQGLYSEHHGWLKSWLHRKLGCSHQAADLAHDTFLRVLVSGRGQGLEEPRAFLTTIAKGLVVSHWRRQDIERAYAEELSLREAGLHPSPEEQALIIEALLAVDRMLAALPDRPRRAFLLSQLDGLTYAEIAVLLAVSERMVKKYMATVMLHCLHLAEEHGH